MKNIKTLAEEIGVSKQAIRNKIANLNLQSSLQKKGNQFLIDEDTERVIRDSFTERAPKNDRFDNRSEQKESTENESQTTLQLIAMLKNELDQKNKQIAELQKIIDQEQQLRLVEHKRLLELEDKLLQVEEDSKETSVIVSEEEQAAAEISAQKKWWEFWKMK